jgi:hypothetical protein
LTTKLLDHCSFVVMGTASSSIVINAAEPAASPSSPPSADPVVDGFIKTLLCVGGGCDDKLEDMARACSFHRFDAWRTPPATDVEKCAKAAAALRKCMTAKAATYDDAEKQQKQGNWS